MSMPTRPSVSVIMPCFNAAPYIGAALRSVLSQPGADLDVVVVDDGSSDGSVDLVRATFPQVRVLTQRNQGPARARNAGIAAAQGDWIAFLDADDIWLAGKLQAQFDAMALVPGARMSYTAWHVWPCLDAEPDPALVAELRAADAKDPRWQGATGWIYPDLLLDCVVWTSTVLMQRSLIDEIGVFEADLRIGEDYDLWLRASRVTPIVRVPRPLALYRMHPHNTTRRAPDVNFQGQVLERAVRRWGLSGPDGREARGRDVARALARTWNDYAEAHLLAGDTSRARRGAWQSVRALPWQRKGWRVLALAAARALR